MVLSDVEEDALAATTAELRAAGGDVHGIVTDVSNPDKVAALAAATLERYGAVHILCNNAGWPVAACRRGRARSTTGRGCSAST